MLGAKIAFLFLNLLRGKPLIIIEYVSSIRKTIHQENAL